MNDFTSVTLEQVIEFAREKHSDQIDKTGKPYFGHIERVIENTRKLLSEFPDGYLSNEDKETALIVAALHDVIEDTDTDIHDLFDLGLNQVQVNYILRLTKVNDGRTYIENIRMMVDEGRPIPIIVKLADNIDNSDEERIRQLPHGLQSIANRYSRSKKLLRRAVDDMLENQYVRKDILV